MVPPGSTIGILGGGQLGRMLALAARQIGYRTAVLCPEVGCPAAAAADHHVAADYTDEAALARFAGLADVATVEFENIPEAALRQVADRLPFHPGYFPVFTCQNREREKTWLRDNGLPVPDFAVASSAAALADAVAQVGTPCVIKTAAFGYDGKGQRKLSSPPGDWHQLWDEMGAGRVIVEAWVEFQCELSVVCARSADGGTAVYDPAENVHTDHILDTSNVPASAPAETLAAAAGLARRIAGRFGYIGVLGVELFLTRDGRLLVNELAPRTHNSGHHTLDACATSQFEQQVRAVCGLPLGDTRLLAPCTMKNLLGDLWLDSPTGEPDWPSLLRDPNAHLHLYGKTTPQRRRKMGHLTTLHPGGEAAL